MNKLLLILFAVALASSPVLAENVGGKTQTTHSQIGKAGKNKNKKHHKKKAAKKHARKKAATKTATA